MTEPTPNDSGGGNAAWWRTISPVGLIWRTISFSVALLVLAWIVKLIWGLTGLSLPSGSSTWLQAIGFIFSSPLYFFITLFFLGVVVAGIRGHMKDGGSGAMHAVSLLAGMSFIIVLSGVLLWAIFQDDASVVVEKVRLWLIELFTPAANNQGGSAQNNSDQVNHQSFDWDTWIDRVLQPEIIIYGLIVVGLLLIFWPEKKKGE